VMDIMYPQNSDGLWRALFKTREDDFDAEMFISSFGGIGINAQYDGTIVAGSWHRVAFTLNNTNGAVILRKYIDGTLEGEQNLGSGVDGRWSLLPSFLLFADNNNETAPGTSTACNFAITR